LENDLKWLLMFAVYTAPPDALNWDGPWELGMTISSEKQFESEEACRNTAISFKSEMQKGMLAPIRFRCVSFDTGLPKGALR
jgi:hypothetical protein